MSAEEKNLEQEAEAAEFAEVAEEDLKAVSGGCNTPSGMFHCDRCSNNYEGDAPHRYTSASGYHHYCESCYQSEKSWYNWDY